MHKIAEVALIVLDRRICDEKKLLMVLLAIETAILIFGVITRPTRDTEEVEQPWNSQDFYDLMLATGTEETELFRETSPDGGYTLMITEVGEPGFPFGSDRLEVTLFEIVPEGETPRRHYRASFMADVANDGARGVYQIEWLEDGVQVLNSEFWSPPTEHYFIHPNRNSGGIASPNHDSAAVLFILSYHSYVRAWLFAAAMTISALIQCCSC
ncbi:MAG: hypothetical protein K2P59_12255 [Acetatifactor sp.]|nr:hypothetical protein [Acetatifactor sp.]